METTYTPSRPPHAPVWATPDAPPVVVPEAEDPPAARRRRSSAAVVLAASSLALGPALWLGLAAWAASAGLPLLAIPLGILGLLAAVVSALLALRGARRHDGTTARQGTPGSSAGHVLFASRVRQSAVTLPDR